MTGFSDVSYLRSAVKNAAVDYILKPVDPEELLAALEKCVSRVREQVRSRSYFSELERYARLSTPLLRQQLLSRVLYGAGVSLEVGIIAVGIGAGFGYLLGLVAGYFEGWTDRVIMCLMDILFAFPSILLAIFISAVLGKGIGPTMVAIGIVNIPVFCRTVRAAVISAKGLEYVKNAQSVGVRTWPILVRHISPNVVAPFTVQATLALSGAILTEATLSFLGMGIQPPDPSWGSMLAEARANMARSPWTALFPLLFIVVTILVFNILGDALRDVLDPKLKV